MVIICNEIDYYTNDDNLYNEYYNLFQYILSPFQKHAIRGIVNGNNVLVTAPTGSGKTLPAEFCILHLTNKGKKIIYASPIKALSNQKYYEFTRKYPDLSIGLITGDIKVNPCADILIMTTEILYNSLFSYYQTQQTDTTLAPKGCLDTDKPVSFHFQMDINTELGGVIFDEIHYINDQERGKVWEGSILLLPHHIQIIGLSATLQNPLGFAKWIEETNPTKQVVLASTSHRIVPLSHYTFLTHTESIFKQTKDNNQKSTVSKGSGFIDKELQKEIRDNTNTLILLQDENGIFQEDSFRKVAKIQNIFDKFRVFQKRKHVLNSLVSHLKDRELLPAICFVFSRKNVELCAHEITVNLLEFDSKVPYITRHECEQIIRKLPNYQEYLRLPEYDSLVGLLEKGIGIHHAGMLPILREIVELFISKKYVKLLFCTETFAIGLDCPIKTAIFTGISKFDGNNQRLLYPHEYTQAAGRSGRRGMDTIGYVVHCNNLFPLPSLIEYKTMLKGNPQNLVSKFKVSYSLILNLIRGGNMDFHKFVSKSMIYEELQTALIHQRKYVSEFQEKIVLKENSIEQLKTPKDVCLTYLDDIPRDVSQKKRKELERNRINMTDKYFTIEKDVIIVNEWKQMNCDIEKEQNHLRFLEDYMDIQIQNTLNVLIDYKFIYNQMYENVDSKNKETNNSYSLTNIGFISSYIFELHPLVFSTILHKYDFFKDFSVIELIGVLSIFCDIKIPEDRRITVNSITDKKILSCVQHIQNTYEIYQSNEIDKGMNTGMRYDAIQFDIIDYVMQWCILTTEEDCKYFIQNSIYEKEISLGDYVKSILKISAIAKELSNMCEKIGNIEFLHKLSKIDDLILKYIVMNQSLYV